MSLSWTTLSVTVPPGAAEAVGNFLLEQGSPGLIEEDRNGHVCLTAHFHDSAPVDEVRDFCVRLASVVPGAEDARIEVQGLTDENWADNWRSHFEPLAVGERLFVHPPWAPCVPDGRLGIEIDPGMAFGTGHHASTRGCLVLLERLLRPCKRAPVVLDLGTGSGILAIAAVRLGAGRVWAVDVDPEACRAARRNAEANGVGARVLLRASLESVPEDCDLVVANLFARQLVELAPHIATKLRPGGVAIGAGILAEEGESVKGAWLSAGFVPIARHEEEGWVTLGFILAEAE